MNILIVEDDQVLGGLLQSYLARIGGHIVTRVEKGKEAIGLLPRFQFDCAFVDLNLPDISGIKVLEAIKDKDPAMPVIMMSGNFSMAASVEAMRLGASDFLAKPFTFQHLLMSLERAFKERQILLDNIALKLEIKAKKELERLNQELEKNLEVQRRLFNLSREFDNVRSSEELYTFFVKWGLKLTRAQEIGFYVILPSGDALFLLAKESVEEGSKEILPKIINLFPRDKVISKYPMPKDSINSLLNLSDLLDVPAEHLRIWTIEVRREVFGLVVAYDPEAKNWIDENERKIFEFLLNKASLTIENLALYESLMANFYSILRSLVNALEAKDIYTGKHSERVTRIAMRIAKVMGRPIEELDAINTIGYLHDIGKIGIPDQILNKPERLTNEEFNIIKQHPSIGEGIVNELGLSDIERSIIRHHHERWDGRGYPDGIGGEDIPVVTRIVTVADSYDAMTSNRPYRKALSRDVVWKEFIENKGTQFDPQVVDALFDTFHRGDEESGE
ncbi:MAG: response regulator [Syntrophobacterales bacterium]|nr:response regulator [Syntrophobacterales bacterium]